MSHTSSARRNLRYGIVITLGFGVDLLVALITRRVFGFPLMLATATGLLFAVAFNYGLFEYWVFGNEKRKPISLRRLVGTYISAGGAIAVRLFAVFLLEYVPGSGPIADLARLIAAAGASIIVNYIVINRIFASSSTTKTS